MEQTRLDSVDLLLPTRGRLDALLHSLNSLAETKGADRLIPIIVCDDDIDSHLTASSFDKQHRFKDYKVVLSPTRLYPVGGFNQAFAESESEIFVWMNDENSYKPDWLDKALGRFFESFPDLIGVLSLYKHKKAGLGMSSKSFVEVNNGEWFHPEYTVYYPDDELTCRAILLGRYDYLPDSGVSHDIEITKEIPIIPPDEKIRWKKIDRSIFYNRSETNFGLTDDRIYTWTGFRTVNFPLRGVPSNE